MSAELEDLAHRLEQQLQSFEQLHAQEMKRFQEQLEAYRRIQSDELQMLRDELAQLKTEIAEQQATEASTKETHDAGQVQLTISRRDLLTGRIPPFTQRNG